MAIKDLTDSELLERISQKDYNAFNELWCRYDRFVISLFQQLLRDKHLAEDSYQQLFMRIWQNSNNYRGGDVKSYLHGIARNIYKETVRKNTRELPMTSFPEYKQEEILSEFSTYSNNSVGDGQLLNEIETKIQEFRAGLPSHHRKIFMLKKESGLCWEEISRKLKIPKVTCKITYSRLKARIRDILKEYTDK